MLQQYLEIKSQHAETILFYRMGDFYEMFFEDAEMASKILNITLTSRSNKQDEVRIPMCGVPYHSVNSYLAKLIKAGKRVAVCEQVENPQDAKGLVKREVVRVVSPGMIADDFLLDAKSNNYLAAVCFPKNIGKALLAGISFLDISTGEFFIGEIACSADSFNSIFDQLACFAPSELIVTDTTENLASFLNAIKLLFPTICITPLASRQSSVSIATTLLLDHFKIHSLDGFGCGAFTQGIIAAGMLLQYAQDTQKTDISHIERIIPLELTNYLQIDESSRRNLELTETIIHGNRNGSLLAVLDQTVTPMGARLLRQYLLFPLRDVSTIRQRLDTVEALLASTHIRNELRNLLASVYDLERLNSRVTLGTANGRDLLAMKQSLAALPKIISLLGTCTDVFLQNLAQSFDVLTDIHEILEASLHLEPPVSLREGNLIAQGYNQELDELTDILRNGKATIASFEQIERESSGIAKLKIGYNRVFGYFIEVSKSNLGSIPERYIRKQTLVNAERFITPELKELEEKILGAEDKRLQLEYDLFCAIRSCVARESSRILKTAHHLAQLDVFATFAEISQKYSYNKPIISDDTTISIEEGRHPVIEQALSQGRFVPNDIHLDQEAQEVIIITGPNMAGKSTILRQTALIVLMAQMGCYVPAQKAAIGIVDRIFTRVGAMDDLRRGQSTFMVEMSETANILHNATDKSLVILDEIGRGTSTYDGLAIAWSVVEELVQKNGKGIKTLFATHYHELTDLALTQERVKNFSVAVREWEDSILFLHKLVAGAINRSYGIQVAALAGVPNHVVLRAKEILNNIEQSELDTSGKPTLARSTFPKKSRKKQNANQLALFQSPSDPLRDYLQSLDVNEVSPKQALEILYNLRKYLS